MEKEELEGKEGGKTVTEWREGREAGEQRRKDKENERKETWPVAPEDLASVPGPLLFFHLRDQ